MKFDYRTLSDSNVGGDERRWHIYKFFSVLKVMVTHFYRREKWAVGGIKVGGLPLLRTLTYKSAWAEKKRKKKKRERDSYSGNGSFLSFLKYVNRK